MISFPSQFPHAKQWLFLTGDKLWPHPNDFLPRKLNSQLDALPQSSPLGLSSLSQVKWAAVTPIPHNCLGGRFSKRGLHSEDLLLLWKYGDVFCTRNPGDPSCRAAACSFLLSPCTRSPYFLCTKSLAVTWSIFKHLKGSDLKLSLDLHCVCVLRALQLRKCSRNTRTPNDRFGFKLTCIRVSCETWKFLNSTIKDHTVDLERKSAAYTFLQGPRWLANKHGSALRFTWRQR